MPRKNAAPAANPNAAPGRPARFADAPAASGRGDWGTDRGGYSRGLPAEARAWIDENQHVEPLHGASSKWDAGATEEQQPWVKNQPPARPAGNPWTEDVDYRSSDASDRW